MLKFATDLGEEGHLTNGADLMMLRNVYGLQSVWCNKGETKRKAAAVAVVMRDSLDALLDIFHDRGKLRTLSDEH